MKKLLLIMTILFEVSFNHVSAGEVVYAGVRSSSYGINPFPEPSGWQNATLSMSQRWDGSTPCAIWIVGEIQNNGCHLFFPSDGGSYNNISFQSTDRHEPYLDCFDNAGIKVFLQVESGMADMNDCIDLVLGRYGHHPCVVGFGVDVEWYKEPENPGTGAQITDAEAQEWEERVQGFNSEYRIFMKHWDREWMPPTYRGDIVFVDDSQGLGSLTSMVNEMGGYWADYFDPNPVIFQIGYDADRSWWDQYQDPPQELGDALSGAVEQECGIIWVDFTLDEVLPTDPVPIVISSRGTQFPSVQMTLFTNAAGHNVNIVTAGLKRLFATLDIYSAKGSLVRRIYQGVPEPSAFSSTWDMRDEQGRCVAQGSYICVLDQGFRSIARSFPVAR